MKVKIDWLNHIIAFLSALLGILIAFQLEDYRENQKDNKELQISLRSIRSEINNNLEIYQTNENQLGDWLEYWEVFNSRNNNDQITITREKYEKLDAHESSRVEGWELIENLNDSVLVFQSIGMILDIAPETGLSMSSWRASLNSGIINRLSNDRLVKLTLIYEWIEKDLGVSESELLILDNALKNTQFTDVDLIVEYYEKVWRVHKYKYGRVHRIYNEMEWE